MVEFERNKHDVQTENHLGELNFLLEHKRRLVGSGNDNDCHVQATGKMMFLLNPVSGRNSIQEHVGLIDSTMLSRCLCWVQDSEETKFLLSSKSVIKIPPTHIQAPFIPPTHTQELYGVYDNDKDILWRMCWGCVNREEFLSIFDTCYRFVSKIEDFKINELINISVDLAKEPMKSVWKGRAYHHIKLLIDGIVKTRCLFQDYDSSFIAKQEDYDLVEKILIRMVKGWDTDLSFKNQWSGNRGEE
jgi:hypothetical protein